MLIFEADYWRPIHIHLPLVWDKFDSAKLQATLRESNSGFTCATRDTLLWSLPTLHLIFKKRRNCVLQNSPSYMFLPYHIIWHEYIYTDLFWVYWWQSPKYFVSFQVGWVYEYTLSLFRFIFRETSLSWFEGNKLFCWCPKLDFHDKSEC